MKRLFAGLATLALLACQPAAELGSTSTTKAKDAKTTEHAETTDGEDDAEGHTGASSSAEETPSADAVPAECDLGTDMSSAAKLKERVSFLASAKLAGRAPGTQGDVDARAHIESVFKCAGLEPGGEGGYQQPFTNSEGKKTANVIGILRGSDATLSDELIVVSAHHDHFGTLGGKGLRLGANDNGSGVAGVLATAIALKQQGGLKRSVAFITFGAEETSTDAPYVEGSAFLVSHPTAKLPLAQIVTVVNMDMIGTFSDAKSLDLMGTAKGTPGRRILDGLLPDFEELSPNLEADAEEGDSDFDPFCRKGIPYVGLYTDDPECYHKSCDVPDHLDYASMSTIVDLVTQLTAGLANDATDLVAAKKKVKDACQFSE